jgi:uncharacterized protein (DUF885 family)
MAKYRIAIPLAILLSASLCLADEIDTIAADYWKWRAAEQPLSLDDMTRLERPPDWAPDWSPTAVAKYRRKLAGFEARWRQINASQMPVARQVDWRLIGSALARARWELDILRGWERNPMFYVDQTLGGIFEGLLQPPPFTDLRAQEIVQRMASIPHTLEHAKQNLRRPAAPFARIALDGLKDVRTRLLTVARELKPQLNAKFHQPLDAATEAAIQALESYRSWLEQRLPTMPQKIAVGRENYVFFLRKVALLPFTPEELLAMSRQEWERAVAFQVYEEQRNRGLPQLAIFADQAAQMSREAKDELAVRKYLAEKELLTVPEWVQHYRNLPLPAYLEPLKALGTNDDLTSPSRLKDNGISYIAPPSPKLGYFALASARDPRPIIVHEGVPGHYLQLVLSWAHEDKIRRHYYDSGANEGIGFYAEEMMLQAGLFDDSPRTREIIYNFARLRALRVEVDVKLATGQFTIDQAADYMARTVPMDLETAHEEVAFFASSPGQAISYQIGKLQIVRLIADARRTQGDKFSFRAVHDFIWKNGNVPLSLQRWELLGLRDELDVIDRTPRVVVPNKTSRAKRRSAIQ